MSRINHLVLVALLSMSGVPFTHADATKVGGRTIDGAMAEGRFGLQLVDGSTPDIILDELSDGRMKGRRDGEHVEIPVEDVLKMSPETGEGVAAKSPAGHHAFFLPDGGFVMGELLPGAASGKTAVLAQIGIGQPVEMRFSALKGLRISAIVVPEVEKSFQERLAEHQSGRDTMILVRDGKPIILQGSLEKLSATGWEFTFGDKTRSGDLSKVYAFVFGAPPTPFPPSEAMLHFVDGNRFGGRLIRADRDVLTIETQFGGALEVPWNIVRKAEFQSARVVYLSDLKPAQSEQRSLPGAMWPARMDSNVTGGPLRLGGRAFVRGVGVHGFSSLSYELKGEFERFSAVIGVDDSVGGSGSVVFRVLGDGKALFESRVMRGGDAPESVVVDLAGFDRLTLECDTADELDLSDHADWANAVLIRRKGAKK